MKEFFIHYAPIASFVVLSLGIVRQIKETKKAGKADQISFVDVLARFLASTILWVGFLLTKQWYYLVGQSSMEIASAWYFCLVIKIKFRRKK